MLKEKIKDIFAENLDVAKKAVALARPIQLAADAMCETFRRGNKVFICGNGGSAAEAQHFAGELVGRFKFDRKGLPVMALGTNSAVLTALSNDYDYSVSLARELEALGQAGDVLIAFSTSGASKNILEAVSAAKKNKIKTIGFSGNRGALKDMVDLPIAVDSASTPRIQEVHLLLIHIISEIVEEKIFG